jgi:LacI family transcriptional regulator
MGITQKEIARDLGISLITVSRAFNNSGYVSKELRKRIKNYAKKKAYEPHRASQVLVRNAIRILGVFSSTTPEFFFDDIKKGVFNAAEIIKHFNYEIHYYRIPDGDTKKYIQMLKREIKNGLDAVALVNQKTFFNMEDIIKVIEKSSIPYLLYNIDDPETNRICYIGTDYSAGGRLVANFIGKSLSVKGNGTVLVINILTDVEPELHSERLKGFLEVIRGQYPKITCQIEHLGGKSKLSAEDQLHELLKKYEHKVDAVYLIPASQSIFLRFLEQLEYSNTITVLHDIDDIILHNLETGLLTAAVYQDPILQGYIVVRTMERILESNIRTRQKDIEIAHTLVFKENVDFTWKRFIE